MRLTPLVAVLPATRGRAIQLNRGEFASNPQHELRCSLSMLHVIGYAAKGWYVHILS